MKILNNNKQVLGVVIPNIKIGTPSEPLISEYYYDMLKEKKVLKAPLNIIVNSRNVWMTPEEILNLKEVVFKRDIKTFPSMFSEMDFDISSRVYRLKDERGECKGGCVFKATKTDEEVMKLDFLDDRGERELACIRCKHKTYI